MFERAVRVRGKEKEREREKEKEKGRERGRNLNGISYLNPSYPSCLFSWQLEMNIFALICATFYVKLCVTMTQKQQSVDPARKSLKS